MRPGGALLSIVVFAGCLFPDFDGLKNDQKTPSRDEEDASAGSSSSASSSSSSSGAAATDAGTVPPGNIACGAVACPVEGKYCCTTAGGPDCQDLGTETFCGIQGVGAGVGNALHCDGREDCADGQVCCLKEQVSTCTATCAGQELCSDDGGCTGGKACTGKVIETFRFCQ